MTLEQLKEKITNKDVNDITVVVFKDTQQFISLQYIKAIAEILNKQIEYFEDYPSLCDSFNNAWLPNTSINVLKVHEFKLNDAFSNKLKNVFIICDTTDVPCIEVPALVDWQIKEYIRVNVDIDEEKLYTLCGGNIWRIQNEIDKLKLFPSPKQVFDQLIEEGQYNDIENGVIWDYITALFNKDVVTCRRMIPKIMTGVCDVTGYFLLTSLINKLVKIIKVKLDPNPSQQSTGLSNKQIWAIRNYECSKITVQELYHIFDELTILDSKIKKGYFPEPWVVDYITLLFLGR